MITQQQQQPTYLNTTNQNPPSVHSRCVIINLNSGGGMLLSMQARNKLDKSAIRSINIVGTGEVLMI